MCVITYNRYKCGCTESKSISLCPMINEAMNLIDNHGAPENSPEIDKLEAQCQDKSASRYEPQREMCDGCGKTIVLAGLEAFLAAKKKYDALEEDRALADLVANEEASDDVVDSGLREVYEVERGVEKAVDGEEMANSGDEEDGMSVLW